MLLMKSEFSPRSSKYRSLIALFLLPDGLFLVLRERVGQSLKRDAIFSDDFTLL